MTLDDLLHELRFNILRDRSDLIAGDTDSLWDDESLLRYIKDAERRFARRTHVLRDSTTPQVVQLRLKNGVPTYALHPSVYGVLSGRFTGMVMDLQRTGHTILQNVSPPESLVFDPTDLAALPPGAPIAFYTDESLVFNQQSRVTLTIYPVPGPDQDNQIVNLRVLRMPLTTYSMDKLDQCSEIPEDYQLDALEWAAYRAQRTWDGDAGAPTTAEQHKAAFEEAIVQCARDVKRNTITQLGIAYGGNGFSWVR